MTRSYSFTTKNSGFELPFSPRSSVDFGAKLLAWEAVAPDQLFAVAAQQQPENGCTAVVAVGFLAYHGGVLQPLFLFDQRLSDETRREIRAELRSQLMQ